MGGPFFRELVFGLQPKYTISDFDANFFLGSLNEVLLPPKIFFCFFNFCGGGDFLKFFGTSLEPLKNRFHGHLTYLTN